MTRYDVAIVGSGFAGSILSRCLRRHDKRVVLLERGRHPRFAIGESSTPLAAIALERLAATYEMKDLERLAAYGRWMGSYPHVRRGLKRGFTFYPHHPGRSLQPVPEGRLLVAASPDDAVADSHWLRADVDAFLVERALADGVEYLGNCEVIDVDETVSGVTVSATREGDTFEVDASFVVDASGPAGAVARRLGASRLSQPARFSSSVVFAHFSGVRPLDELWREDGTEPESGPYPDERAAVHHLLEEGWVYVLPFDHDCVSAGLVADGEVDRSQAESLWQKTLERYPTLGRQFEGAETLRPLAVVSPLQHRLTAAAGDCWAALPHVYSFLDPMFSTGIAWSLLGVERLAALLGSAGGVSPEELKRYSRRLSVEADQIERLLYGAHLARADFSAYVAHTQLYFALVSFEEVRQRLFDGPNGEAGERRFLGGGDEWAERLLGEAVARLERWFVTGREAAGTEAYEQWVAEAIASRNIAGLADPTRRNLYPVDLDLLVERSGLLGLAPEEMQRLLPRLRGVRTEALA